MRAAVVRFTGKLTLVRSMNEEKLDHSTNNIDFGFTF